MPLFTMKKTKRIQIEIAALVSVMLIILSFNLAFSSESIFVLKDVPKDSGNNGKEFVEDEIIVKYKGDVKPFRIVKVSKGKVTQKISEYLTRQDVEYAEPNYIAYALMAPNDPLYTYQWHLYNPVHKGINMQSAWDISQGSGVTVAIIDTGVAYENYERYKQAPDLANTCFAAGYDFVNNDAHPNDDHYHGTHVAGTVAQSTNNSIGVAGVAFGSCLMPIKVLDRTGGGTYDQVADGIRFAADNGAKVINLSLGGRGFSQTLKNAVAYAYNKGVTIIAAAGNDGKNILLYPAAYDEYVIAVGATRYDELLSGYSNFGPSLDLVAPGGDTSVDQNGDRYPDGVLQNTFNPNTRDTGDFDYWLLQGTSMAAPHVSGVAALLISKAVATNPQDVRAALESTAKDLGAVGRDDIYGWGLVDAAAALGWGDKDNPPTIAITYPVDGSTVIGEITITADAADDNAVTQVDFYIDASLLGSDTETPYEWLWDSTTVADDLHAISATAIDAISQIGTDSIIITVDNMLDEGTMHIGDITFKSDQDKYQIGTVELFINKLYNDVKADNVLEDLYVNIFSPFPEEVTKESGLIWINELESARDPGKFNYYTNLYNSSERYLACMDDECKDVCLVYPELQPEPGDIYCNKEVKSLKFFARGMVSDAWIYLLPSPPEADVIAYNRTWDYLQILGRNFFESIVKLERRGKTGWEFQKGPLISVVSPNEIRLNLDKEKYLTPGDYSLQIINTGYGARSSGAVASPAYYFRCDEDECGN